MRAELDVALVSEHASPLAVLGEADAGGQNVYVDALARHLARLGCRVTVYTRRTDRTTADRTELHPGVSVVQVCAGPPEPVAKDELLPHMREFGNQLLRHQRLQRHDIIHAHFWMSGLASLRVAHAFGVPYVQTFHALGVVKTRHQGDADTSPPERQRSELRLARAADLVLATCADEVDELLAMGGRRSNVAVVPCGVDTDAFVPARRPVRGPFRLLSVSRLVPRKGVDDVVRALPLAPGVVLDVVGGAPADSLDRDEEVCRLRSIAEASGVADRVEFHGALRHEEVVEVMQAADAAVCTPWYEPFGIVPLEAMACGLPVIAAAVGGLRDTVVHDVTGLHVLPRDRLAIAAAIRRLRDDEPLRLRMGAAGRRRAVSQYSWPSVARRVLDAYRTCLDRELEVTA
jgi:glycosyltransferase involved in cell wall biosynthesis